MLAVFQGQGNHGPLVVGAGGHFQRAVLRGRVLREQLAALVHAVHEVMAFLHAAVRLGGGKGDDFARREGLHTGFFTTATAGSQGTGQTQAGTDVEGMFHILNPCKISINDVHITIIDPG